MHLLKALCESLEDTVYKLRKEMVEKNSEIDLLRDELALYKKQVEMLTTALRFGVMTCILLDIWYLGS